MSDVPRRAAVPEEGERRWELIGSNDQFGRKNVVLGPLLELGERIEVAPVAVPAPREEEPGNDGVDPTDRRF